MPSLKIKKYQTGGEGKFSGGQPNKNTKFIPGKEAPSFYEMQKGKSNSVPIKQTTNPQKLTTKNIGDKPAVKQTTNQIQIFRNPEKVPGTGFNYYTIIYPDGKRLVMAGNLLQGKGTIDSVNDFVNIGKPNDPDSPYAPNRMRLQSLSVSEKGFYPYNEALNLVKNQDMYLGKVPYKNTYIPKNQKDLASSGLYVAHPQYESTPEMREGYWKAMLERKGMWNTANDTVAPVMYYNLDPNTGEPNSQEYLGTHVRAYPNAQIPSKKKGGVNTFDYSKRVMAKDVTDKNKNIDWVKRGQDVSKGKVDWNKGNATHLLQTIGPEIPYSKPYGVMPSIGPKGESNQPIWFENKEDADWYSRYGLIPHYQKGKTITLSEKPTVADNTRTQPVQKKIINDRKTITQQTGIHPKFLHSTNDYFYISKHDEKKLEKEIENNPLIDFEKFGNRIDEIQFRDFYKPLKDYTAKSIESPMYKKRLKREFDDNNENVSPKELNYHIQNRLNNINTVAVREENPEDSDHLGEYDARFHYITMPSVRRYLDDRSTAIHEMSHASTKGNKGLINRENFVHGFDNNNPVFKEYPELFFYYRSPTEIKARLDAARYHLYENGILDSNKDEVEQKHIDWLRKNKNIDGNIKDLFRLFPNDNELNYKFNWTAMNKTNPKLLAKQGGLLKQGYNYDSPFNHLSEIDFSRAIRNGKLHMTTVKSPSVKFEAKTNQGRKIQGVMKQGGNYMFENLKSFKELKPMYQQGGKVKPYITSDINDFNKRKQAYQDSLLAYTVGEKTFKIWDDNKNQPGFVQHYKKNKINPNKIYNDFNITPIEELEVIQTPKNKPIEHDINTTTVTNWYNKPINSFTDLFDTDFYKTDTTKTNTNNQKELKEKSLSVFKIQRYKKPVQQVIYNPDTRAKTPIAKLETLRLNTKSDNKKKTVSSVMQNKQVVPTYNEYEQWKGKNIPDYDMKHNPMPYHKYQQGGKVKPFITSDVNEFNKRKEAYNDSLALYNFSQLQEKVIPKNSGLSGLINYESEERKKNKLKRQGLKSFDEARNNFDKDKLDILNNKNKDANYRFNTKDTPLHILGDSLVKNNINFSYINSSNSPDLLHKNINPINSWEEKPKSWNEIPATNFKYKKPVQDVWYQPKQEVDDKPQTKVVLKSINEVSKNNKTDNINKLNSLPVKELVYNKEKNNVLKQVEFPSKIIPQYSEFEQWKGKNIPNYDMKHKPISYHKYQQGGAIQVNGETGQPETVVQSGARIFSREHTNQLVKAWKSGDLEGLGNLVKKIYKIQENTKPQYTDK